MTNFFTDNEDLLFHLENTNLDEMITIHEKNFEESRTYDHAPGDVGDALDGYRRVLTMVGQLASDYFAPRSSQIDEEGTTLKQGEVIYAKGIQESLEMLRKADLMGINLPRKYGGLHFPQFIFNMMVEIISQADASLENIFGLHGVAEIIDLYGDKELKDKFLPLFCSGYVTGAMALTESQAGSDLQNVQLKAKENNDGTWSLNGVKRFITNGNADILLVLARSEPDSSGGLGLSLFLCEKGDTIKIRRLEDKMGIHGSPTCELQFTDTKGFLIGERRRGLVTYVMTLLNGARLATSAQAVGISQAAYNVAREFAYSRKQFGQRIESFPQIAEILIEMQTNIEAARALNLETAYMLDIGFGLFKILEENKCTKEEYPALNKKRKQIERLINFLTPLAKYFGTEKSLEITSFAIQILGGSGYMRDYPLEQYFRDARITTIYEGTSQIQIAAALRGILGGNAEKYFSTLATEVYVRPLIKLAREMEKARKLLDKALHYLEGKKDKLYIDLVSKDLVDITSDIIIGYLFLRQAKRSDRKFIMAKRFIHYLLPKVRMRTEKILKGDKTTLSHFQLLAGPPTRK
ncbi:MAG: acyl-CoA dehydrogenase family protein [Thermodesulfobacteriota bacterium]|nr:acyl-CoA dehydrogenase family protein [Thermodesulfobacteriota bacterium]